MSDSDAPSSRGRCECWILGLLVVGFALFVIWLLRYVLLPFVIAGALAYVLGSVVRWTGRKWNWPRWLGAGVIFVFVLAIMAGIGWVIDIWVLPQVRSLLATFPDTIGRFLRLLFRGDSIQFMGQPRSISTIVEQLRSTLSQYLDNPDSLLHAIVDGVGAGIGLTLTLFLLLFFMIDGPRLARGAIWVVPPPAREKVRIIARRSGPVINRYIFGIIFVVIYATALTWIVMGPVLHVHGAILLALAVGFLELIPVVGPILALLLMGIAAIEQANFWTILGICIFAIGLRLSIDQLVGPVVLGRAVKLPAPLILFAFVAGGAIYGPLGVFLAIPAAAVGKIALEEIYGDGKPERFERG